MHCNLSAVTRGRLGPYSTRECHPGVENGIFLCVLFSPEHPQLTYPVARWPGVMPGLRCPDYGISQQPKPNGISMAVPDRGLSLLAAHRHRTASLQTHQRLGFTTSGFSPGTEFSLLVRYHGVSLGGPDNSSHLGPDPGMALTATQPPASPQRASGTGQKTLRALEM